MKNIFGSSMLRFEWQTCRGNHMVGCAYLRMRIKRRWWRACAIVGKTRDFGKLKPMAHTKT